MIERILSFDELMEGPTPVWRSFSKALWRYSIDISSFSSNHCITNGSNHLNQWGEQWSIGFKSRILSWAFVSSESCLTLVYRFSCFATSKLLIDEKWTIDHWSKEEKVLLRIFRNRISCFGNNSNWFIIKLFHLKVKFHISRTFDFSSFSWNTCMF